ncbi:hypothetical protein [Desulfosarcina variabilis]|uniref:hypothetical protein n=1 Tax=Desulfosarcina variabilis TaxID=2300 RepID=UPI003AFB0B9D
MQHHCTRQCKSFARRLLWVLAVCLTIVSPIAGHVVYASQDEVYRYRENNGDTVKNVQWRLTKGDHYTLTCSSPEAEHITVTDGNYITRHWQMSSNDGETQLIAERTGRTIVIRGRFEGKAVDKVLAIDDCPWYQATSLSLREFVASADTERLFWTIHLKTLKAYKIRAIKKEVERSDVNDDLLHIRLTLSGLLAPFWKSDYWFALPDGVFYRFQGPSGPPGSPRIIITRTAG